MARYIVSKLVVFAAVCSLIGVVAGLGVFHYGMPSSARADAPRSPQQVSVPAGTDSASALQEASSMAGFEVTQPAQLAVGDSLVGISMSSDIKERSFRHVELLVRGVRGGMLLSETNGPFKLGADAVRVADSSGQPVWKTEGSEARTYFAFRADGRGCSVQVRDTSTYSEGEIVDVLEQMVR